MKALPITHKALNSPAKVSMEFLVQNDNQLHKEFQDIGGDYAAGRKEGIKMTQKKGSQRGEPTNDKPPVELKQPPINVKEQSKTTGPQTEADSKIPSILKG